MKTIAALVLLLAAAGCSSPTDALPGDFTTEADAGNDVIAPPTSTGTAGAAGAPGADSGGKGGAGGSGGQAPDAAPAIDSGSKVDEGNDAGTSPEATPPTVDAGTTGPDSAPPRVDAGNDAGNSTDAATADVDARTGDGGHPCTASPATCDNVNRDEALIRATFTQSCTNFASTRCGGVNNQGVVETAPLTCAADGHWSFAWCLNTACYECTKSCPLNQLCDP